MYYIKGSKHLYLIDYNEEKNLPVWSNAKEEAVGFRNQTDVRRMQQFLKAEHNVLYEVAFESI